MFYSQLLLSKNGPLGTVWIAAHCYSKLRKDQVQQTDIPSSVDKILGDEVPVVAHRILAYLLLGVVRIYSKKVEYLFHDCNDVLSKLCEFNIGKSTRVSVGYTPRTRHSVKRPKRFALDEFNLELQEDRDLVDRNIRPPEQLLLTAGLGEEGSTSNVLYKDIVLYQGSPSTSHTPPRDVLSPHPLERELTRSPSRNINTLTESPEALRETSFCLEDRLEPMEFDEDEEEQIRDKSSSEVLDNLEKLTREKGYESVAGPSNDTNMAVLLEKDHGTVNSLASEEVLHQTNFSLEDRLEPIELYEAEEEEEEEQMCNKGNESTVVLGNLEVLTHEKGYESVVEPSNDKGNVVPSLEKDHATVVSLDVDAAEKEPLNDMHDGNSDHETRGDTEISKLHSVGDEAHEAIGSVDKEQSIGADKMKTMEIATPKSKKRQRPEKRHISISVDVTPDSKVAEGGVAGARDMTTVRTPAPRESAKIFKKRKVVLDSSLVVLNSEYKNWLNNPRDLMRKESRVPQTRLQAWRAHKLCRIPESFLDALIHSNSIDPPRESNMSTVAERRVILENHDNVASPVKHEDHRGTMEARSPITCEDKEQTVEDTQKIPEDTPVAPSTPVTQVHLSSFRTHEHEVGPADLDLMEPTSSLEKMERASHPIEEVELDADFYTEEANLAGGNFDQGNDAYSERTRMAETYLRKNFLVKKKRKEDEVLNLSQLLSGKTKQESARLFYEILVLKTRDCINVEQESAYEEIHLRKTSKFVESS